MVAAAAPDGPHADPFALARARRKRRRWVWRAVWLAVFGTWASVALWHARLPIPDGVRVDAPWQTVPAQDLRFLSDLTTADGYGRPVVSQEIFDETLRLIGASHEFLVVDFFLFNEHRGALADGDAPQRPLARELRDALVRRKLEIPDIRILFITDPINDVYGGSPSPHLASLREAGIDVVVTDLDRLPDSNPLYSGLWRLGIAWWSGDGAGEGWLPNPLDDGPSRVSFRSWARLLNFKANHRKVVIGDDGEGGLAGIVSSANPHDASSAHSNVAVRIEGPVLEPLLASELAIARFSGWTGMLERRPLPPAIAASGDFASGAAVRARAVTEGAIRSATVGRIDATVSGDSIDIAMFYLADRAVIESLLRASARGVNVRLILDPNKDAFGREKSGVPNRPVAAELASASEGAIKVRWYRTHGEQFHTKLVMVYDAERLWFTLGSANLTRRNIGDYNLEANVVVEAARTAEPAREVLQYFETLWTNRAPVGIEYTADFGVYADPAQSRYWQYRLMEATGLSTF
jgi:phosphatidylserine/phosphatidylglycerophosphate/cardiolipin synthase-like enzyme